MFSNVRVAGTGSGDVVAQNQVVSVDMTNCSVEEFLREIKEQTGIRFMYKSEYVEAIPRFDVRVKDRQVMDLLDEVFAGKGIKCLYDNGVIVIDKSTTTKRTGRGGDQGCREGREGATVAGSDRFNQGNDDWGGDGFERGVFTDNRETRFPDTAVFVHRDEEPGSEVDRTEDAARGVAG